ncbi:MAG: DUF427 domain-containing protein [Chloroflexaceae bacterium]|nr:DUF427 domain-containing protein [Chloroflexaceae bacterium]
MNRRVAPGPGQESVWDYPRPPRLEPVDKQIRIVLGGVEIANTRRAYRVLETSHPPSYYLPPDDMRRESISPAAGGSFCEWKGQASYWTISANGLTLPAVAWSYENPSQAFAAIRGFLACYAGPFEAARTGFAGDGCYVDGLLVTPQPGGFYGGWITPEIVGPFKGGPGTMGW